MQHLFSALVLSTFRRDSYLSGRAAAAVLFGSRFWLRGRRSMLQAATAEGQETPS